MTSIPTAVKSALESDPFMRRCVHKYLKNPTPCDGRIEWEHTSYWEGSKIQEAWAIVPLCTGHHRGGRLDKKYGLMFALHRANDETLVRYSKAEDLLQKRDYLISKYQDALIPGTLNRIGKAPNEV